MHQDEPLIWAYEGMSMDALRSLVRGIRKKLNNEKLNNGEIDVTYIENVSGVGYRLLTY